MFGNMQMIAVALLVVAFVPARVLSKGDPDTQTEGYVSDLYSATDHTLVGSFKYTDAGNWLDVEVDKPLHFTSKYPYVAITLHRAEDVSHTCKISGPALIDRKGNPLEIYSGKVTGILDKSSFNIMLRTSFLPNVKSTIANARVAMYSANAEDPKLSPIACGKIRKFATADNFLEGYTNKITETKPTDLPITNRRHISPDLLTKVEAVTDLYDSESSSFVGLIAYRTLDENSLEVGVLHLPYTWYGSIVGAVVYDSKDVMPGCLTIGPAVSIRDIDNELNACSLLLLSTFVPTPNKERNSTLPVVLFMSEFANLHTPFYGNVVDYASVSPRSDFDIMDRVVVIYDFKNDWRYSYNMGNELLQPTNVYNVIACGAIRSIHASEDDFLKWAPARPKPTTISEKRKCIQIIDSVDHRFQNPMPPQGEEWVDNP